MNYFFKSLRFPSLRGAQMQVKCFFCFGLLYDFIMMEICMISFALVGFWVLSLANSFFLLGKWAAGGMQFTKRSFYDWVHWPYYIARQGNWWLVMYRWGFLTGSEFLAGHPCYLLHVTRRAAGLLRSHSLSWLFCLLRLLVWFYLCTCVLRRLDHPCLRMGQLGSCFRLYFLSFV